MNLPSGLFSLPFTLWDRWIKGRPQVWAVSEDFFGLKPYLYLAIQNPPKIPIRITSIRVKPAFFQIMDDHSVEAAAKVFDNRPPSALIEADETKHFPIVLPDWISDENRDLPCDVVVYWRSLRNEHIPRSPVLYRTTIKNLEDRRDGRA
jgi:hypothetical protein